MTIEFPRRGGPDAARFQACLRISGPELDPVRVSALLGLEPAQAHRRGDPRYGSQRRQYSDYSVGVWILEPGLHPASSLLDQLERLLWLADGKQESLRSIAAQGNSVEILIGVFDLGDNAEFQLPADLLLRLSSIGAGLGFDVYP